ncbi:MAG TPA: hypothetical protein VGP63_26790 [Planctomycetaceae bacterium]|jgi:hypothetical protein|nr:hypothetical protein [Planctomycetaceae bacterium]
MDVSTVLSLSAWLVRWLLKRGFPAVEALDLPPTNWRAASYRAAALYFFLIFAGLFLCGSLLHVRGNPQASEIVGWTGMGCFMIAALCVLKYASINGQCDEAESGGLFESLKNGVSD